MSFHFSWFFKKSGFTLIEMLVAVIIIIFLASVIVANLEIGQYQFALQLAAHEVAQDLRNVEEMALAAEGSKKCGTPQHPVVPEGGYGIYFSTSTPHEYFIYADCDGNGFDQDDKIITKKLDESVEILDLIPNENSDLYITFIPPDPKVLMNGNEGYSATIVLKGKTKIAKVYVSRIGLIETD